MSHSITAFRPNIDREQIRGVFNLEGDDAGWTDRFDAYRAATEIASLSRSSSNSLNAAIYIALGVMEEAYAGDSGNGATIAVSREQFDTAFEILKKRDFSKLPLQRVGESLIDIFRKAGVTVIEGCPGKDVTPEITFVEKCLKFMAYSECKTLDVCFC